VHRPITCENIGARFRQLDHVNHDHGDIVLPGNQGRLPVTYLSEQFLRQFRGWVVLLLTLNGAP